MWEKIKNWFMKTADLNKDGKFTAEDLELARALADKKAKEANEKINEAVTEVKTRVNRVKEEVTDVVNAAKEVANQVGDVAAAAKGKARKGRKKK
jgi:methyl-accepting chemotaxis protein